MSTALIKRIEATPRLYELTVKQNSELGEYLMGIAMMVGVREEPDPKTEIPTMVKFLKGNFAHLTFSEVGIAFELYCAGKLNCKAEHYGTFNLKFLGSVLNAYNEFKVELARRYQPSGDRQLQLTDEVPEPVRIQRLYLGFLDMFARLEKFPVTFDWDACYYFVKSQGRMELSKEQKTEIREQVEAQVKSEIMEFANPMSAGHQIAKALNDNRNIQARCRAEAFRQFVQNESMNYETIKKFAAAERDRANIA